MAQDSPIQRAAGAIFWHLRRGKSPDEAIAWVQAREPELTEAELRQALRWALAQQQLGDQCRCPDCGERWGMRPACSSCGGDIQASQSCPDCDGKPTGRVCCLGCGRTPPHRPFRDAIEQAGLPYEGGE